MTTSSSTDSTDRVEDVEELLDAEPHADEPTEIVAELVEEDDDLVEGAATADHFGADATPSGTGGIVAAGAAAVTAAGLAITSLGGNWLGNILSQRQSLIANINTPNSTADVIIKQRYTDVWHKTAFVSMGFAIAAVVIAAATLFLGAFAAKEQPPVWVRVLTWGALLLGVIGLGISLVMYFDVFTGTITVPAGSATGSQ